MTKLILKTKISKNIATLIEYRIKLIEAYNSSITYISSRYQTANENNKNAYDLRLTYIRNKVEQCFNRLNCIYEFGDTQFSPIDPTLIGDPSVDTEEDTDTEQTGNPSTSNRYGTDSGLASNLNRISPSGSIDSLHSAGSHNSEDCSLSRVERLIQNGSDKFGISPHG